MAMPVPSCSCLGPQRSHRLLALALLPVAALSACGPVYRAKADPGVAAAAMGAPQPAIPPSAAADADPRRLLGTWALTDNDNLLFNLLLRADGSALTAAGSRGPGKESTGRLTEQDVVEVGRWRGWVNGLRVDYSDGWTDTILVSPGGPIQWSWQPGSDRNGPPTNTGKAVRLTAPEMAWVGVYRLTPTQPQLPPYLATLLSSGRAFNTIDTIAAGSWRQESNRLVIDWASGWRTTFERSSAPAAGSRFEVLHWAPGRDRQGPASAGRSGERL